MGEGVPITNTLFPPPPVYYKAFTAQNVARFAALRGEGATTGAEGEGSSTSTTAAASTSTSAAAGIDEAALAAPPAPGELDRLASELSPPRADWVREDGRWMLFGQMYTTKPHIPTAREVGLPPLVADPVSQGGDSERAALPMLLHSFLHTLLALVDILTGTARIPGELEAAGRASEGDQYIQHLSNLTATMMLSANQLRGVQAEATLVMLMEKQLEERRLQTGRLKDKCAEISATIRRLKAAASAEVAASGAAEGDAEVKATEEGGLGAGGGAAEAAKNEAATVDEAMAVDEA